jgi:S1-C subfamily serine protease
MKAWPMLEGEAIIIVGFPYGMVKVVTYGEVQARFINPDDGREYVLTTAGSLPGNSGGGVFDADGYLVGILAMGDPTGSLTLYVEVMPWVVMP